MRKTKTFLWMMMLGLWWNPMIFNPLRVPNFKVKASSWTWSLRRRFLVLISIQILPNKFDENNYILHNQHHHHHHDCDTMKVTAVKSQITIRHNLWQLYCPQQHCTFTFIIIIMVIIIIMIIMTIVIIIIISKSSGYTNIAPLIITS